MNIINVHLAYMSEREKCKKESITENVQVKNSERNIKFTTANLKNYDTCM